MRGRYSERFCRPTLPVAGRAGAYPRGRPGRGARAVWRVRGPVPCNSPPPLVRLAVARTYECERSGMPPSPNTAPGSPPSLTTGNYQARSFPGALDCFKGASRETNALMLLTNFVARFPTNERGAQWWIGGYCISQPGLPECGEELSTRLQPVHPQPAAGGRVIRPRGRGHGALQLFRCHPRLFHPPQATRIRLPTSRDQVLFAWWGDALVSRIPPTSLRTSEMPSRCSARFHHQPRGRVRAGKNGDCRLQLAALAVSNTAHAEVSNAYRGHRLALSASMNAAARPESAWDAWRRAWLP